MIVALFNVIFPEFISFCGFQISTTCNFIDKIVYGLILWVVKSPLGYENSGIRIDILLREVSFLIGFIQFIIPDNVFIVLKFVCILIRERVGIVREVIIILIRGRVGIVLGVIIVLISIIVLGR